MARIIGIDYGTKRVGIAVTDPLRIIASPLETIETSKIFDYLKKYCTSEIVDLFIIGYPKDLMNRDMEITKKVDVFINQLKTIFPNTELMKVDERFTSKIAFQTILQTGINKTKRKDKSLVDKISACLLLQSYLELNHK
jgi:putative Holliday junction resolvase